MSRWAGRNLLNLIAKPLQEDIEAVEGYDSQVGRKSVFQRAHQRISSAEEKGKRSANLRSSRSADRLDVDFLALFADGTSIANDAFGLCMLLVRVH
jgi:hypothetical protein